MIPKNNSALMTIANTTIARMLASGELQSLYDKWVAPYGAPREGVTEALFKVEAIEE
jgi:ABC-type amino acid transport substrate-binding protein